MLMRTEGFYICQSLCVMFPTFCLALGGSTITGCIFDAQPAVVGAAQKLIILPSSCGTFKYLTPKLFSVFPFLCFLAVFVPSAFCATSLIFSSEFV